MSKGKLTLSESLAVKAAVARRIYEIKDAIAELKVNSEFQELSDNDKEYLLALGDEKKQLDSAAKKLFYLTFVELL